ncbi:acyl-CoA dehydrogenase family protein [Mycolicibacterium sp. XJ1819]
MTTSPMPLLTPEHRAMCELIADLTSGPLKRGADSERARKTLADSGIWALGIPEHLGGGGADHLTTMIAIRQVSIGWPAMGLGMAQLHACMPLINAASSHASTLSSAIERGDAVGVVDLSVVGAGDGSTRIERFDALGGNAHLLVLRGSEFCVVSTSELARREPVRCTGLDGMVACAADLAERVSWRPAVADDEVRASLYSGMIAVTAGLVHRAAASALTYAQSRVQFGGPLTALPTMRDELVRLRAAADLLEAQIHAGEPTVARAAGILLDALDTAVDIAARALQCFGGYGYLEEYPAAGLLRDAVSLRAVADAAGIGQIAAAAAVISVR